MQAEIQVKIIYGFIVVALTALVAWSILKPAVNGTLAADVTVVDQVDQTDKLAPPAENQAAMQAARELEQAAQLRFATANDFVAKQQWPEAIIALEGLVADYPDQIEPYINLATAYAESGRLDDARLMLVQGIKAKPDYAILYNNLQSIHGVLAAQAYRAALDSQENETLDLATIVVPELSLMSALDLDPATTVEANQQQTNLDRISDLEGLLMATKVQLEQQAASHAKQIAELEASNQNQADELLQQTLTHVDDESELENELQNVKREIKRQAADYSRQIAELEEQLLKEQKRQTKTVARELSSPKPNPKPLPPVVERKVGEQTASPEPIETVPSVSRLIVPEQLPDVVTRVEPQIAAQTTVTPETEQKTGAQQQKIATDLVQTWAQSWADQDVAAYIAKYSDHFSPSSRNITHQQWLDESQTRIENKSFIEVDVSDLTVEKFTDNQISVTFMQRYRSNVVEGHVRKRLIFANNGSEWSQAKIIEEATLED